VFPRRILLISSCVVLGLGACVGYRPCPVSVPTTADAIPRLEEGALSFEEAVRLLVARSPELRRLRAEAAAVNLRPGPDPLFLNTQIEDGNVTETMIGTDLLALLGVGPTGARRALARARRSERIFTHHERARALVAQLAEAYAVERALRELPSPEPELDVEAFEAAGLASAASVSAAASARAQAAAEVDVVAASLRDVRREIAQLVAAGPESRIVPVGTVAGWPTVPAPDETALLYTRGDLLRGLAAYAVADHELRLAVARQWPNLGVFLGGNVHLENPMQMVRIALPLEAPAEARAMVMAREAARLRFSELVLDALHDAAGARLDLEKAAATYRGAAARRAAAAAVVRAAQARIETSAEDAFPEAVLAASEEVQAAVVMRMAAVSLARARVRAAHASGWPGPTDYGDWR
jgi:outer membrane protein TolC